MPDYVQCPGCPAKLRIPPEQHDRMVRCPKCERVFRPTSSPGSPPAGDKPDPPRSIKEPPLQKRPVLLPIPDDEPAHPRGASAALPVPDDDEPAPARPRRAGTTPQKPRALFLVLGALALAFVIGSAVGGYFLVNYLTARAGPKAGGTEAANAPAEPGAPEGEKGPGGAAVEAAAPAPAFPATLRLGGMVSALYPGGDGRYVLFHLPTRRQLVVYDVSARKIINTIEDIDPNALVAAGRDKVFVGSPGDGRITRFDIRTGAQEARVTPPVPEQLQHLAVGTGTDGPLVSGAHAPDNRYHARLHDADTLAPLPCPINDPVPIAPQAFPFARSVGSLPIGASADGRAVTIGDRLYLRTVTGYRAVPINSSSGFLPSPDGRAVLGTSLVTADGRAGQLDSRQLRWFMPAAAGPFFLSIERAREASQTTRLVLYTTQESVPVGELPGIDELTDWVSARTAGMSGLVRHVAFFPNPGLVVFASGGSSTVHLFPVDMPALLAKGNRDVLFTSVPPAAVTKGRPYTYTATAATRDGSRATFTLGDGPAGMTVTEDGRLTWVPGASQQMDTVNVLLVARTAAGGQVTNGFQVIVPSEPSTTVLAPSVPPPLGPKLPPSKQPGLPLMAEPTKTVELNGPASAVAVGGGGRYVCLYLPSARQIAVFDATLGKIAKYLPAAGDKLRIAAGAEKLFVLSPVDGVVQRWDLKTFEKEATAPLVLKSGLCGAGMGSASAGPLWLIDGDALAAVDPRTLKRSEVKWDGQPALVRDGETGIRVSADGHTLGLWRFGVSPSGLIVGTRAGDAVKVTYRHESVGHVTPGPDGRAVYTAHGRVTPAGDVIGNPVFQPEPRYCLPAAEGGSLYLTVNWGRTAGRPRPGDPPSALSVHWAADESKLTDLLGIVPPVGANTWDREPIRGDQRFMLIPSAKLLAVLPGTNDKLLLYPFDLEVLLAKDGREYLWVEGPVAPSAVRGQPFVQALAYKSKGGRVEAKLKSGPDGMTVSPEGRIAWRVPKDFSEDEAVAVLTVSNESGRKVLQTVRIEIRGEKPAAVAVAPKDPPVPVKPPPAPREPVPAKEPPAAKGEPTTVKLPGAITNAVAGAGGKLLILYLPKEKQLAVFDVAQGKVVKYLPTAEDGVLIAAGQDHLFVANPAARVLQRYSLKTFEKEATVPQPIEGTIAGLCMGSASKGPLLVCPKSDQWGAKPVLVEPIKLKAIPGSDQLPPAAAPFVRASADGRVFGWRNGTGSEGHDMTLVEITDGKPKPRAVGASSSLFLPSPDGRYVFCGEGVFNIQFKKLHPMEGNGQFNQPFLPAASGNLFMQLELGGGGRFPGDPAAKPGPGRVNFFLPGQYRPFASIDKVEGLTGEAYGYGAVPDPVMHDRRVHLYPDAGRLVTVPSTNDKLVIYPFDLDDLLAKSGTDYLLVTSEPPLDAARGSGFSYAPVVRSKKGGARVRLDSGPDGMKMVDGKLVWNVPADFADKEVDVILTVSDATGQELFQTFKLTVRERKAGDPEALPEARPAKEPAKEPSAAPKDSTTVGPIRPTPFKSDTAEVALPAPVTDLCLGGGGRFVILHLAKTRQLAVFDVNEGKVVKYLPVGGDGVKFAAGQDKLFVVVPAARAIQRWNLATLEKEVTAPLALTGDVKALLMGHAARGPLFVAVGADARFAQAPSVFLDPTTLKPIEMKAQPFHGMKVEQMSASADGSVIVGANDWMGTASATISGTAVKMFHNGSAVAHPGGPSADGRFLYGHGIWTSELKQVGGTAQQLYVPAVQGPFFYSTRPKDGATPAKIEFYVAGQTRPFASIDPPDFGAAAAAPGILRPGPISEGKRGIWVPAAKLIVALSRSDDKLYLMRVDVDDLLKSTAIDYLVVFSTPPAEAARGGRFDYPLDVRSKAGGTVVRLESGPAGMKVTGTRVTWDVPATFTDPEAAVILTVTDNKGQEVFHNFKIAVRAPRAGEPAPVGEKGPGDEKGSPAAPPRPADPPAPSKTKPTDLTLKPAALEKDEQTVNLPSAAAHVVPAAGGRLLIVHLPKERKLAIFDTVAAKVVKYLPLAEDEAQIAAGCDKLLVFLPGANVFQRWDLATLEREGTVANPVDKPVKAIAMGSNSDGPLVVTTRSAANAFESPAILLFDAKTFKASAYTFGEEGRGAGMFHPQYPPEVRVSANGEMITAWVWGLSPSGVYIWSREGKKYKGVHHHDSWGSLQPDADGRTVFATAKAATADGKVLTGAPKGLVVPALHGSLLLSLDIGEGGGTARRAVRAALHLDRGSRPLLTLPELTGLDAPADRFGAAPALGLDQRVFLVPDARLLVVVPEAGDKLILHKFDLDALLEKSGTDYLFVTGRPPAAVRGAPFRYAPEVKSKKGGAKVTLDAGPEGMKLVGGAVTWDVPKDFSDSSVSVILTISDKTGQETLHTLTLRVTER